MTQRGDHTWDIVISYHKCPHCEYIIEDRTKYEYHNGMYVKELQCPKCKHVFKVKKNVKLRVGPLIGEPEHTEVDWSA